jgi:hypothetical protein
MRYELVCLDDQGVVLQEPIEIQPTGPLVVLPLPYTSLDYMITRLTALRSGRRVRRALEVHLARQGTAWRIVGVRH